MAVEGWAVLVLVLNVVGMESATQALKMIIVTINIVGVIILALPALKFFLAKSGRNTLVTVSIVYWVFLYLQEAKIFY